MEKTIVTLKRPLQRLTYLPPEFEVYNYVVEKGFANSPKMHIANSETVSELQDPTSGSSLGENYHGEWF